MKKPLKIKSIPKVDRVWDEGDLELGNDSVLWAIVVNGLQGFGSKMITYDNTLALKSGNSIIKSGKVFSRYDYCKIHGKTWHGKKGDNTGHIRHRTYSLLY